MRGDGIERAGLPRVGNQRRMMTPGFGLRRQRRRWMTDRQHQQIGLKLQAAVGGHHPLMKSERPIAQVAKPSAAGRRGVGKTLRHIATKLAALRVDGTVRAQRLHIDGKGRLMAVPMIEGALFVAGQLHASGRNVNPVRRLRGGVGHPGPGDWRGSSSVTRTPFGAARAAAQSPPPRR